MLKYLNYVQVNKICILSYVFLLFLQATVLPVLANECTPPKEEDICYSSLLPRFVQNPYTGVIGYYSYSIVGAYDEHAERCKETGLKLIYNYNELNTRHIGTSRKSHKRDCVFGKVFSEPINIVAGEKKKNARVTGRSLSKQISYQELDLMWESNELGGYNLELSSVFQKSITSLSRFLDVPYTWIESEEAVWKYFPSGRPRKPLVDTNKPEGLVSRYQYGEQPYLSSNGCWLVISSSKFEEATNYFIHKKQQYLYVHSLNEGTTEKLCTTPGYRTQGSKLTRTVFDLLHDQGYIENTVEAGVDYAAFSPLESPNLLHLVYQTGFESDTCYPESSCDYSKPVEKNLTGDLRYTIYRRDNESQPVINERKINLTKACSFQGWELNPKFSRDKSKLFFLAMEKKSDASSRASLFVVDVDTVIKEIGRLPENSPAEYSFSCKESGDEKNLFNLTSNLNFDYPILGYSLSSDLKTVQIIFEERGESVVRFYKLNKHANKIVYEYPNYISGVGKIYDIATSNYQTSNSGYPIYYIFHSHLNYPVSISRCYFSGMRFVCGERYSPVQTTHLGIRISGYRSADSTGAIKVSVLRRATISKTQNDRTIDVFVLSPAASKSNKKAIISIHGGPNESWDGRFSPREFRLASLGYTVYMPNPVGSTGYGYEVKELGHRSWGKNIFYEVRDLIDEVYESKVNGEYSNVYLMGFSFGGYMANWIQTKGEVRSKLDGIIAVNGLFDLGDFASSTDQLWFPEHEIGCSYPESKRAKECDYDSWDEPTCWKSVPCKSESCLNSDPSSQMITTEMLTEQNPACFAKSDENEIEKPAPPILIIFGDRDQRIPYYYNVPPMLRAYRERCIAHTIHLDKWGQHGFTERKEVNNADAIHQWILDIENCGTPQRSGSFLNCEYDEDGSNAYLGRGNNATFVFDNPWCYSKDTLLHGVNHRDCPKKNYSGDAPYLYSQCR